MTRFATNLKFNMMKKHYIFLLSILFLGSYTSVAQDSCEVLGCTDETACNFDISANTDDGSCTYAQVSEQNSDFLDNCDGTCLDEDSNGVCDYNQVGCSDETACNTFSFAVTNDDGTAGLAIATIDDGSCTYPEENFNCDGSCEDADNDGVCDVVDDCVGTEDAIGVCDGECAEDSDGDGVCDDVEVDGCTDETACNFDSSATENDGSCTYPPAGFNCDGSCVDLDSDGVCDDVDECPNDPLNDADNDGVCADDEVDGCTDSTATNYDATATEDDGSCVPFVYGCTDETACNYDEANNTDDNSCEYPLDGFNCDGSCVDTDGDTVCDEAEIAGCTDSTAFNFDEAATDDDGSCEEVTEGCLDTELANGDATGNFCGDCNTYCPDTDGDGVGDCCEPVLLGCTDNTACNFDSAANTSDGNCNYPTPGFDCDGECIDDDSDGICDLVDDCVGNEINFDTDDDGETDCVACETDDYVPFTCDLDGDGTYECINDEDGDGVCDENEVPGCTDETVCNYNEDATDDDGSCFDDTCDTDCDEETGEFTDGDTDGDGVCNDDEVAGCTDDTAYNYNSDATDDDGSCDNNGYLGDGSCLDTDMDGTCDLIDNCTDETACNYMDSDNGECVFPVPNADCDGCEDGYTDVDGVCKETMGGCMDVLSCNYMSDATFDDGSCEGVVGCDLPFMFNYNPVPVEGCEGDDCVGTADCIDNTSCIEYVLGCMNEDACNYNADANADNGTCNLPVDNCSECGDDGELVAIDTDEDGVCDADEVEGCTDSTACNFSSDATDDDGSCLVPDACDECEYDTDGNFVALNDGDADDDGVCDVDEVDGCTDMLACNYDPAATDDDGSCDGVIGCSDPSMQNYTATGYDCLSNAMYAENEWCVMFIQGCIDETACNYNPDANFSTACIYPEQSYLDCDGNCLNDCDENGVCDELDFVGCTNPDACNTTYFIADADGFPVLGSDGIAITFNIPVGDDGTVYTIASVDNGTCLPYGCGQPWSFNYNEEAVATGCIDNTLCVDWNLGCTDMFACNYNGEANYDDGSCLYASNGSTISNPSCEECVDVDGDGTFEYVDLIDSDGDGVGDCEDIIEGCTDPEAINYDPNANTDDGSCEYDTSSIEEVTSSFELLVYPNPADNFITIELDSNNKVDAKIMVINQLGQIVDSRDISTLSSTTIDVANYPSGLYQVTVATHKDVVNKSLMIR